VLIVKLSRYGVVVMDPLLFIAVLGLVVVSGVVFYFIISHHENPDKILEELEDNKKTANETADKLVASQAELTGRLAQLSDSQVAHQSKLMELMQTQEKEVTKKVEERLADMMKRFGEGMEKSHVNQQTTMGELKERLILIDAAQKNIEELSSQVVSLQDILSNKQARGAFGEIQLADLVRSVMPPNAYSFQATLGGSRRVDCLLTLPNPPGSIAIDAKFPLESYRALINANNDAERLVARKAFATDVLKHVRDISEKYIVPGETAESALMFLPSEAVYAELHANLPDVIEKSWRFKVWIVSPTTLMATLNTIRAVLKDAQMRDQAHIIQKEVTLMLTDVERLDGRVEKLETHFRQAEDDIKQIRVSTDKITKRGSKIEEIEVGNEKLEHEEKKDPVPEINQPILKLHGAVDG
jgi:DNA recombination protein RmuC